MIKFLREIQDRFFEDVYQTDLDIATCRERLTNKYLKKLKQEENDLLLKDEWWWKFGFGTPEGETIVFIAVCFIQNRYSIRARLVQNGDKTTIVLRFANRLGLVAAMQVVGCALFAMFISYQQYNTVDAQEPIHLF